MRKRLLTKGHDRYQFCYTFCNQVHLADSYVRVIVCCSFSKARIEFASISRDAVACVRFYGHRSCPLCRYKLNMVMRSMLYLFLHIALYCWRCHTMAPGFPSQSRNLTLSCSCISYTCSPSWRITLCKLPFPHDTADTPPLQRIT